MWHCFAYKLHQNVFDGRARPGPAVETPHADRLAGFRGLLLREGKGTEVRRGRWRKRREYRGKSRKKNEKKREKGKKRGSFVVSKILKASTVPDRTHHTRSERNALASNDGFGVGEFKYAIWIIQARQQRELNQIKAKNKTVIQFGTRYQGIGLSNALHVINVSYLSIFFLHWPEWKINHNKVRAIRLKVFCSDKLCYLGAHEQWIAA